MGNAVSQNIHMSCLSYPIRNHTFGVHQIWRTVPFVYFPNLKCDHHMLHIMQDNKHVYNGTFKLLHIQKHLHI